MIIGIPFHYRIIQALTLCNIGHQVHIHIHVCSDIHLTILEPRCTRALGGVVLPLYFVYCIYLDGPACLAYQLHTISVCTGKPSR